MKLKKLKALFTVSMVAAIFCIQAEAQKARSTVASTIRSNAGATSRRSFEPVVLGQSRSFVIEGRVVTAGKGRIQIRTARRSIIQFESDAQTTYLQSGGLISISTLPDVSLKLSDLRAADRVEIVAEREGQRYVARIVTRIVE